MWKALKTQSSPSEEVKATAASDNAVLKSTVAALQSQLKGTVKIDSICIYVHNVLNNVSISVWMLSAQSNSSANDIAALKSTIAALQSQLAGIHKMFNR